MQLGFSNQYGSIHTLLILLSNKYRKSFDIFFNSSDPLLISNNHWQNKHSQFWHSLSYYLHENSNYNIDQYELCHHHKRHKIYRRYHRTDTAVDRASCRIVTIRSQSILKKLLNSTKMKRSTIIT